MDLAGTLALSIKVLSDWRVIFIAAAVVLLWAVLRYVGSVYRNRLPRRAGPTIPRSPKKAFSRPRKSRASPKSAPEGEEEEGMVE